MDTPCHFYNNPNTAMNILSSVSKYKRFSLRYIIKQKYNPRLQTMYIMTFTDFGKLLPESSLANSLIPIFLYPHQHFMR